MKILKQKRGLVLLLALWPSYSFCDPYTYGVTGNAASSSLSWGMPDVLPYIPGIDINGLIYRYTAKKETEADMKVHIGNKNISNDGYIFKHTDDWSGVPGNKIVKSFSFNNIPSSNWGTGSISVEGDGSVEDAVVIYSFRIDECFDEQSNPNCPGYVKPIPKLPEYEIYVATDDEDVLNAIDVDLEYEYDDEGEIITEDEEKEKETRLEMGLMASENALTMFKTQGQAEIINTMNMQTDIAMYYNSTINGGIYNDKAKLVDGNISDNKRGLRNNLAQQILHEQMVDMQYKK